MPDTSRPVLLPAVSRWRQLSTGDRFSDLIAGLITAALLVPQGMAYATLAGLPAQAGLYTALAPLMLYALFGTSRVIAMGPMALTSLLVGETLRDANIPLSSIAGDAALLAALVGGWLLLIHVCRLGRLIDFVSPSVMQGFTTASALMIVLSQTSDLLGIGDAAGNAIERLLTLAWSLGDITPGAALFGGTAMVLLLLMRWLLSPLLERLGLPKTAAAVLGKTGPLIVLILALLLAPLWPGTLDQVGQIPAGLPLPALPTLSLEAMNALWLPALGIALINYVSAISVAQTLAAKHRERLYPQRELWVLGAANLLAALTRGFPVTSGLGRAVVNEQAGSKTPLSSLFAALALMAVLLLATSLFAPLPQAVLAAIVIQAAIPLVDPGPLWRAWRYSRADGLAWLAAFAGVLLLGVMQGLLAGVGIALALLLARASRPHIAEIGQLPDGGFRNCERFDVERMPHLMMVRPDANLHFANMGALERWINEHLSEHDQVTDMVLVLSSVTHIDGAALHALETLDERLAEQGIALHLAELRGPVRDQLRHTAFMSDHRPRVFFTCAAAWQALSDDGIEFNI
ncbi:sulfate permease, SulP family [Kushneria avicenniae]|uniref:Sulfate permease, SulP family n=1 Tax=Kushneria avicenniae TaxID=402385 RepID=A0A1I1KV92_9GAMM|nr:SulP family inorganic anion transporter [Kushneria avicenniae]SFC64724.1 sulfate permease, SulP family [Kushneria avicenniae]